MVFMYHVMDALLYFVTRSYCTKFAVAGAVCGLIFIAGSLVKMGGASRD